MKYLLPFLLLACPVLADTPAPGTVKAKLYSGDGNTAFTATGTALDVNVTNGGGSSTVNQGVAGLDPWFVSVRNNAPLPVNACQETGGNLAAILAALQGTISVDGSGHTQPISAGSLPLPSGAATAAKQPALGTAGTPSADVLSVQGHSGMTPLLVDASGTTLTATVDQGTPGPSASPWPVSVQGTATVSGTVTANAGTGTFNVDASGHTVPVSGTFWQSTQPVSAAALPLPSGASTSAKQPALGTSGTPSADVITVQGHSGMTALLVDGSGATQPVSGTVTANAGTGTFTVDGSGHTQPVSGTFWQATQPVSGTVTANAGTGTFTVDGSGHTQPVSGTFWQATQPVSGTVTANIGTSGSLALDASVTGLQVSQGATTSGQKGTLSLGAVTTAAPSYTTAQSSPFSLTTAGALRIDGSATTQPVSGTFWQSTQPVSVATLPALTAGSALIGKVGIDQTTPGTTNGVQVNAALPAGSNVIGHVIADSGSTTAATQSGTWTVQPGNTANTTAWLVNSQPKTPTALTVKQAAISVGSSAVRLTNDGNAPPSTRVLLVAQLLSSSTANCYFGSSGVTTTSTTRGVQMFAGQSLAFNNDAGDYYAICDTSAQTIFITEQE